jgi:predicted Holliday junction resolvase-like endonuclease
MEMYIKTVVELLSSNSEEFLGLFNESKGLCIRHFVTLVYVTKENTLDQSRGLIETITKVEEKNLLRLNSELDEYIRRQSYEFTEKDREAVEDVVRRSIEKLAGRRGLKLSSLFETRVK